MKNNKKKFPMPALELGGIKEKFDEPYPYPIPPEVFPELPYPKSLCEFAESCPIDDTICNFDNETVLQCAHATKAGCPLYILKFNEFESFGEVKDVQLFEIGQPYSNHITIEMLKEIVKNFNILKSYHEVPMAVLGHSEDQNMLKESGLPAAGWLSNLRQIGKRLVGDFKDVPKLIAPLLKNGAYKKKSIELYPNFDYNGNNLKTVLRRVAFLGFDIPKIKGLGDILARYSEKSKISPNNNLLTFFVEDLKMEKFLQRFKYDGFSESNRFSLDDIIISESKTGKIIELSKDTISVELDAENYFAEGDTFSNANGATGSFAESKVPAAYEKDFDATSKRIIEKIGCTKANILSAILASANKRTLSKIDKDILQYGWPEIHGSEPTKFKATSTYPYPDPEKMSEDIKVKLEKFQEFQNENKKLKSELERQQSLIETQTTRIKTIEDDRSKEMSILHLEDVQHFSESLKKQGVAPAIFDESSFRPFILSLDWKNTLKFSENKEPATFYAQFKELFSEVVEMAKENKLIVPLTNVPPSDPERVEVTGYDPDGVELDIKIRRYAEENKTSYDEAYSIILTEETKKNRK